jgi:hypothetical protein
MSGEEAYNLTLTPSVLLALDLTTGALTLAQ